MEALNKKRVIVAAVVIAAAAAAALLYFDDTLRYEIKDSFSRIGESLEIEESDAETVTVSLDDLAEDERVVFDRSMMLINTDFRLEDGFVPDIVEYKDTGVYLNSCASEAFANLSADVMSRFGETLYVSSSYRTAEEQRQEIEEAGDVAQQLGASEHQAGLALDVYVKFFAGEGFLKSETGRWVNENCDRYGFIIRYPYYGTAETGIGYEPWHIRYIGLPHSEIIAENSMTLEGYYSSLEIGKLYSCRAGGDSWIITRQSGGTFDIPKRFKSAVVSPDNTGGYILTFNLG